MLGVSWFSHTHTHVCMYLCIYIAVTVNLMCNDNVGGLCGMADIVCSLPVVNCVEGKCRYSNDSSHSIYVPGFGPVGFDCDCYPGWKKIQIGPFTYPSCLVPNCESFS